VHLKQIRSVTLIDSIEEQSGWISFPPLRLMVHERRRHAE